ncbi:MAG: ribonuclease E/G [Defluviitaleaceae bacterium]|nr:ribonuclease E/G [Defluviitaleaceae bacterium]
MKKILMTRTTGTAGDEYLTALTQDGKLIELLKDGEDESIVGNVYLGVVKQTGGHFIFFDIGYGHMSQAFLDTRDNREKGKFSKRSPQLKVGDTMLVQVLKDRNEDKGPNVTSCISFTGRYVIVSKSVNEDKAGISRKILGDDEHKRLKAIARDCLPPKFSIIFRSAAEGMCEDVIKNEIKALLDRFTQCLDFTGEEVPCVVWSREAIVKTLFEVIQEDIDEISIDDEATYESICKDLLPLYPDFEDKISLYSGEESLFAANLLETQIEKIHNKRVWLKCGGSIVIEQTEACVVIDVNSSKCFTGGDGVRCSINMEAAKEALFQIRLRNLSGIIIIDFLRMNIKENMYKLLDFLQAEAKKDRMAIVVVGETTLGLVELTRKKGRKPLTLK